MSSSIARAPVPRHRLLVVVSHDFGELGMARDFMRGLEDGFALEWLLPPHLFALNPNHGIDTVAAYHDGSDIVERIETLRPVAVLLFSAYLLIADRVVGLHGLRRLVRAARGVSAQLITSDPFLGLTREFRRDDLNVAQFPDNRAAARSLQFVMGQLTAWRYRLMDRCLRSAAVVAPFDPCPGDGSVLRYFHPPPAPSSSASQWVFVISTFDMRIQFAERGESRFLDTLCARLCDAVGLGRPACLVAPPALCESVRRRLGDGVALAPPTDLASFKTLLASAERVFYWNMVSHSLYERFVGQHAIHFFDRGHVSRIMPRLHSRAVKTYFGGHEPPLIAFDQPLSLPELLQKDVAFRGLHQQRLQTLRSLPSSREVLARLGIKA